MSRRSSRGPHSRRFHSTPGQQRARPEARTELANHSKGGAKQRGDFVMGRNCVEEIVKHAPGRIQEVFLASVNEDAVAGGGRRRALSDQLRDLGIPLQQRTRTELDDLVGSDSHQGVVARVVPRSLLTIEDLVELTRSARFSRVLALDGVVDPHNFGAVLRAAECFGVDAVVWSKNRAAPMGPVVSKVSVGASELIPLCPVSNLHRVLELLKQEGVWLVGALLSDDAVSLDSFEFPEKCLIVMGSEGEGIQQLIERSLDFRVMIPMSGDISSLNVSQATAVMLSELSKQHRRMDKAASLK